MKKKIIQQQTQSQRDTNLVENSLLQNTQFVQFTKQNLLTNTS